jgi:hypothetical protein
VKTDALTVEGGKTVGVWGFFFETSCEQWLEKGREFQDDRWIGSKSAHRKHLIFRIDLVAGHYWHTSST